MWPRVRRWAKRQGKIQNPPHYPPFKLCFSWFNDLLMPYAITCSREQQWPIQYYSIRYCPRIIREYLPHGSNHELDCVYPLSSNSCFQTNKGIIPIMDYMNVQPRGDRDNSSTHYFFVLALERSYLLMWGHGDDSQEKTEQNGNIPHYCTPHKTTSLPMGIRSLFDVLPFFSWFIFIRTSFIQSFGK